MDYTNRSRFNNFRKAMRWTWKNIESITGRKHGRTNAARKVPAWSLLALKANERYVAVIQQHLMQLMRSYLGQEWICHTTDTGFHFTKSDNTSQWLDFYYPHALYQSDGFLVMDAGFIIESNTTKIYEVAQQLSLLYTETEVIGPDAEGEFKITMALNFSEEPKADRETMAKYFRSRKSM